MAAGNVMLVSDQQLTALAMNCTLKASPLPSSGDLMAGQFLDALQAHRVSTSEVRVVDHDVAPGVETDMGPTVAVLFSNSWRPPCPPRSGPAAQGPSPVWYWISSISRARSPVTTTVSTLPSRCIRDTPAWSAPGTVPTA